MVSRNVILAISLLATPALATKAFADPPDWTQAGGGLFIEPGMAVDRAPMVQQASMPPQTLPRVVQQAGPASPRQRPNPASQPEFDPIVIDTVLDYGEVRLLPSKQPLDALISQIAGETGLDPKLLHALVIVESAYDPGAVSPVGARGLTQLMPGTARELGVTDSFDIVQNLRGGARYLAIQIGRFGDLRLALAAYNSGPGRVARLGRVPDIAETQGYVRDAVDCYLALSAGRGIRHRHQCRTSGGR
ncbi:lytic transglycosylase domain-containing protein [Aquidulcibacter paucihalophilus]|uniref:lytic transglycosylase domain-containing protein n=1 Tax=Aquidulcibacter paucihalophilus TaxID=1978549 RepID=UPI000A19A88D|nr:lytic transglycosylase domain-containing protein [Aquidulcibacter paucihalophilus]